MTRLLFSIGCQQMMKLVSGIIGVLLFALACSRPELADYYPLVAGARRTLQLVTRTTTGGGASEQDTSIVTELVRGENDIAGLGRVWIVETRRDSNPPAFAFFRRHDDAIIQIVPSDEGRPPTEILYLTIPLAEGLRWYDTRAHSKVMEVVNFDTVDVPAGRFANCYQVRVTGIRSEWTLSQWFAPDVGVVKWDQRACWFDADSVPHEIHRVGELISYEPPPPPALIPAPR